MESWVIPILTAIGGAAVALIGRVSIEWFKRPRFKIDFEEYDNQKPYILDLFMGRMDFTKSNRAKFLRLIVHNIGRTPAMDCEAKMVILKNGEKETFAPSMHWGRRDPELYCEPNQIYAPIHINRSDDEPLDIFTLPYHPEEPELGVGVCIKSVSHRALSFERNATYLLKVTVYASNTISKPFVFTLLWDGTVQGFDNAVSKGRKDG
jgi:hypothetical protein